MNRNEVDKFYKNIKEINKENYLILTYYIECCGDPYYAAACFCAEQSTAQWKRINISEDLRPQFAAYVIELIIKEKKQNGFSYDVNIDWKGEVSICQITIAYPYHNFGPRIPNLLSAICGEGTFYTPNVPIVKLLDIIFPDDYLAYFTGPKFGIAGIREILKIYDRPIFLGVLKPNIGLAPDDLCKLGYESWCGGLDIAKDDELLSNHEWCSLEQRVTLMESARQRAEKITGENKIYLANITDEVDSLCNLHDVAVNRGANALLINTMPVGLSGVRMLSRHSIVPLFAHFPLMAAFTRIPNFGIHSRVLIKLQRLVGCDAIIMPGFGSRMHTIENEVNENIAACLNPMGLIKPCLPIPGGSDWAGTLNNLYQKVGSIDFGFVVGRGIFNHPGGPWAGAASIRQAWDAIVTGVNISEQANDHPELAAAIRAFNNPIV